jgi:hypothetical protein
MSGRNITNEDSPFHIKPFMVKPLIDDIHGIDQMNHSKYIYYENNHLIR